MQQQQQQQQLMMMMMTMTSTTMMMMTQRVRIELPELLGLVFTSTAVVNLDHFIL